MNVADSLKLLRKYETCPECGNGLLGNGEGTLEIDDDTFKRSCKCGWHVEVNVGDDFG